MSAAGPVVEGGKEPAASEGGKVKGEGGCISEGRQSSFVVEVEVTVGAESLQGA